MIKLEKLEKGEFFEDAFLVSYRYNKDYLNKMRSLKYKRYVPDKKAWEIPSSELKHLVDLLRHLSKGGGNSGGRWFDGGSCSPFYLDVANASGTRGRNVGGRLLYVPQADKPKYLYKVMAA